MRKSKVARTEGAVADTRPDLKLTYDDYVTFPDDGKRREIIDGELFVTPAPTIRHQRLSMRLTGFILEHLRAHGGGELFAAPTDVLLSEVDVVQPDLLFVSSDRKDQVAEACVQGAPDLVVEILSPTTRRTDETTKRKRYEQFDVREYWIVDPEIDTVKVYRRGAKGLERIAELSLEAGDTLTTPLLPGFAIPLARIFE